MAHVLIIDDDMDITRLLQTHLADEGHTVTVTHDGKSGMQQLMRQTPDLIMLDVFLPDITGYQMCNQIRKNDSTTTTPIIMMTGAARFPNQQVYGRQRGANEYIFKPFDIVEVGELVQKYISPGAAPKEESGMIKDMDNLAALNAFLKRSLDKPTETDDETKGTDMNVLPQIPEPLEPLATFGRIVIEPTVSSNGHSNGNGNGYHALNALPAPFVPQVPLVPQVPFVPQAPFVPQPPAAPPVQPIIPALVSTASENFVPQAFGSKEQFLDFGLDIFALATRLCSNPAEQYMASQLMRTSSSVGAKLHLSSFATSSPEFSFQISAALQDLREAAYWLMLARKTGLLEKLTKADLEKNCQSLITVLTDYQKKR